MEVEIFRYITTALLEVSYWIVIFGSFYILKKIYDKFNIKELSILAGFMLLFVLLRLKFSLFSPAHPHDHYVNMINNLMFNYNNHNFFGIEHIYPASSGFYELFYNRILLLFPVFDVFKVYYISFVVSIFSGLALFYFAYIVTNKKQISFLALFIYTLLPITIKASSAEIIFVLNSYLILQFYIFSVLLYNKPSLLYTVLLLGSFTSVVFCRPDVAVFFIISCLIILSYLVLTKRIVKKDFGVKWNLISLAIILLVTSYFFLSVVLPNFNTGVETIMNVKLIELPSIFLVGNFLDISRNYYYNYFHFFYSPAYLYFCFSLSLIIIPLFIRKLLPLMFINIIFMFVFISAWSSDFSDSFRTSLVIFPYVSIQVAYIMYFVLNEFKINQKYIFLICYVLVGLSFFQNFNFLNMEPGKKVEQDFIIKNMKCLPENSLLLTVHKKKYSLDNFPRLEEYETVQHGLEFPEYLLAECNTDIMDIYKEYNPDIISSYEHVYYYKSMYSYHEFAAPRATADFESRHLLTPVEEKMVFNYDYNTESVETLLAGESLSVITPQNNLLIGLYEVRFNE